MKTPFSVLGARASNGSGFRDRVAFDGHIATDESAVTLLMSPVWVVAEFQALLDSEACHDGVTYREGMPR